MSKKTVIIVVVLALLGIGGVTGYFVLSGRSSSDAGAKRAVSLLPKTPNKEEARVVADVLYEDTSGFSFKHPKDVKVTDVTPEDDEYYTKLNLSRGSEKLVITVKDTSAKTVDDWLKADSIYSGASLVGATTLGGISAKQYSKGETLITVAVDEGVVYLFEGPKDDGFWEDTENAILPTFTFATSAPSGTSSAGSSDIEYEEEEVVE